MPEPPKMGKITILQKLKGLERSFLFLSPHFQPTEFIYNSFKYSQLLFTSKFGASGAKMGPKTIENGQNHYISETIMYCWE